MSSYLDLNLSLTPEQRALKDGVHQFAQQVLRPAAFALDKLAGPRDVIAKGSPLWPALAAAYQQKFHTALIPAAAGGLGLDGLSLHIALEELGWGSSEFAACIAAAGFPFACAAGTGDAGLIREVVAPFVADREARSVGCWAITEPTSGSDQFLAGMPSSRDARLAGDVRARREGDHWVIDGEKAAWVSNGTIATHAVLHVSLDRTRGIAGNGVFFVPLDLPGVSKGEPLDKMGQRALNQGGIVLRGVKVPARYLLVPPEAYEGFLVRTLCLTNSAVAAIFTGVARAAFEDALAYAKTRVQGGVPIAEHQLVQKHLFDMFTLVETCRALSRAASVHNAAANPPALEVAIAAKTYCTQASLDVASTSLQLHGGKGLRRDGLPEKLFRDARASLIEDGVNDVLALVGARRLLERGA